MLLSFVNFILPTKCYVLIGMEFGFCSRFLDSQNQTDCVIEIVEILKTSFLCLHCIQNLKCSLQYIEIEKKRFDKL